jgi:hypothetical protein
MAEHEAFAGLRRLAVKTVDDLAVGAADAERKRAHENGTVGERRLVDLVEPRGIRYAGQYGDGPQPTLRTK